MIRCTNCSSSQHEIEDCRVDIKDLSAAQAVAEATKAAHGKSDAQ